MCYFNFKVSIVLMKGDGPGNAEPYLWTVFFKNVQPWDGLAEQMDKLCAEVTSAHAKQIINAQRAEAIQTQLQTIRDEMGSQDRD